MIVGIVFFDASILNGWPMPGNPKTKSSGQDWQCALNLSPNSGKMTIQSP